MAPITRPSHLINPTASSLQLERSASHVDGVPRAVEDSIRYETSRLIQVAGILLRLPQEAIAQAIVILQRFFIGPDAASLVEIDAWDAATASLYLAAKPSGYSLSPRSTLTVFAFLKAVYPDYHAVATGDHEVTHDWHLSEGDYEIARSRMYRVESYILRVLGFQTHVALPYSLCINYLQALEVFPSHDEGSRVAKPAFAHLNGALLSPQLLYLTHQPPAIATAAIYLAARELEVKLPEVEWWEVFDVDRETLGFLVVAFQSLEGYAREERRDWGRRKVPLTKGALQVELDRRRRLGGM